MLAIIFIGNNNIVLTKLTDLGIKQLNQKKGIVAGRKLQK